MSQHGKRLWSEAARQDWTPGVRLWSIWIVPEASEWMHPLSGVETSDCALQQPVPRGGVAEREGERSTGYTRSTPISYSCGRFTSPESRSFASGDRPLRTEMMRMILNTPCCPAFCTLSLLCSAASGRVSRRTRIPLTTGAASDRNVDASCFTRSGQAH